MTRFADICHDEWIAAPAARVRAQFADLRHHIDANVHPRLRLQILQQSAYRARYVQQVRWLGRWRRDVFVREFEPGGDMLDTAIAGRNKGGSLHFTFTPELRDGRVGTGVRISARLPLPPWVGVLLRPLVEARVRRELRCATAEDKHDIESGRYATAAALQPARPRLRSVA